MLKYSFLFWRRISEKSRNFAPDFQQYMIISLSDENAVCNAIKPKTRKTIWYSSLSILSFFFFLLSSHAKQIGKSNNKDKSCMESRERATWYNLPKKFRLGSFNIWPGTICTWRVVPGRPDTYPRGMRLRRSRVRLFNYYRQHYYSLLRSCSRRPWTEFLFAILMCGFTPLSPRCRNRHTVVHTFIYLHT